MGEPRALPRKKPVQREAMEQRALIQWAAAAHGRWPELEWLFHPANGGKRGKIAASMLKAEGVRPGVPDLILLKPRGVYLGLVIELKATGSRYSDISKDQLKWLRQLRQEGYCACAVNGWVIAKKLLEAYLSLGPFNASNRMLKIPLGLWIESEGEL